MRTTPITITGFILVAAISLASCGGSVMTQGPGLPSPSASPTDEVPASALVITRTGGIAGVRDVLEIAADGTAQITSKTGETRTCMPDPTALDALRAIDLAAVGSGPPKSPIADGFIYSLVSAGGSVSAGDGDNVGPRAEFVRAAAAVLSSCVATQSSPGFPTQ